MAIRRKADRADRLGMASQCEHFEARSDIPKFGRVVGAVCEDSATIWRVAEPVDGAGVTWDGKYHPSSLGVPDVQRIVMAGSRNLPAVWGKAHGLTTD